MAQPKQTTTTKCREGKELHKNILGKKRKNNFSVRETDAKCLPPHTMTPPCQIRNVLNIDKEGKLMEKELFTLQAQFGSTIRTCETFGGIHPVLYHR